MAGPGVGELRIAAPEEIPKLFCIRGERGFERAAAPRDERGGETVRPLVVRPGPFAEIGHSCPCASRRGLGRAGFAIERRAACEGGGERHRDCGSGSTDGRGAMQGHEWHHFTCTLMDAMRLKAPPEPFTGTCLKGG